MIKKGNVRTKNISKISNLSIFPREQEAYLEPYQTSITKDFYKNSEQLLEKTIHI